MDGLQVRVVIQNLRRLSKKVKIHLSVTPAKAGGHADKHNLVRERMPARLWRIYDLRGQDLEMDFFDSLQKS